MGHYIHKPPSSSYAEFLDTQEFNGKTTKEGQRFVKPIDKPKMSGEDEM